MIETLGTLALAAGHNLQARYDDIGGSGNSIENPRTPLDRVFDTVGSYTGKHISELSSLQSTAVWACVRLIAGAIGKIPLVTMESTGKGKILFQNHYCWPLLMVAANPLQTAYRFKRLMQTWVLLWGNAYAEMEISGRGQVVNLWPWRPDRVEIYDRQGNSNPDLPMFGDSSDLVYVYRDNYGRQRGVPGNMMLHLRGLECSGVKGLSVLGAARQTFSLDQAAMEYGARFFDNNGRPGGYLATPNKLGSEGRKRLREDYEDVHRGLRGAHRIAVLEEGLKYYDVGVPPEDMQFLQTRQFQAIDIARFFGVPPHKIAELSRATFSNIEHQSIEWVQDCLGDWMENWSTECMHSMLSERDIRSGISLQFLSNKFIRGDMKSRFEAYSLATMGGWMSPNDCRVEEDWNPIDGLDVYSAPLNAAPIAGADKPDPLVDPEGDPAGEVTGKKPKRLPAPNAGDEPVAAGDTKGDA